MAHFDIHPLDLWSLTREIGVAGFVDIAFMSMILYAVFVWFKRRRAFFVLAGIAIVGLVYLLAHEFGLILTSFVLQSFFAVILIAVIIIFQEELKYFFEQVAVWSLNRKFRGSSAPSSQTPRVVDILTNTLTDLSGQRIGALVVLKGMGTIDRHITGGFGLNGDLSEPLLKSIFDPHSVGHDGAVLVDGERVVRFGCQLPLAKDFSRSGRGGMRHAAAVGISEVSDALCLVVSEETGRVSAAVGGRLEDLGAPGEARRLRAVLEKFYADLAPSKKRSFLANLFVRNFREKAFSLLITLALWYAVVHETRIIHRTFVLPVEYTDPSPELYVESVEPKVVSVTFSGPRHAFQFMDPNEIRAVLKLYNYGRGEWSVSLSDANMTVPPGTILEDIDPTMVLVEIEAK
ncbi:MAG TPA: diadenylate cyclase [bacterium]|nr:diadenylate cyclase [bacterium]